MDSFHSDSPTYKTESWECPSSVRKRLIPDSSTIYDSLRSAKKFIETTITSVQAYQVPECSVAELESPPRLVAPLSVFAPQIRQEETEKVGDSVAQENFSVDVAEMANHSIQMEWHNNAFEAQCIPLEKEPLVLSSPMAMDTVEVEGYQVRAELESIVRKVLTKHEDLFKSCTLSSMVYRSMLLEMICDIISELQEKDLHKITEAELNSMIGLANEIKDMKVNIEWLILRLEEILEARQILNQSGILKGKKYINETIIQTVKRELEECEAEKKKFQSIFNKICDKETACKETLARAQDECARISQTLTYAKSIVRPFVNCSLVDGLL